MPIYEYRCQHCGHRFELMRAMSQAEEAAICPSCQQDASRIPSTFAAFSSGGNGTTAIAGAGGCSACSGGVCSTCSHS